MDTPAGITADDVRTMQGLAQKVTALRPDLLGGEATYGELAWSWGQAVSLIGDAWRRRLVYDGDELIGWGWATAPYTVTRPDGTVRESKKSSLAYQYHPERPDALDEIFAWFEEVSPDELDRYVIPPSCDTDAVARLAALGYVLDEEANDEAEGDWHQYNRRGLDEIEQPELPPGFRFTSAAEAGPEATVRAHRDAWPNTMFNARAYEDVFALDAYRPELHVMVAAPDGTIAAAATAWFDAANKTAEFEPVGTHVEYRRRGLAHALLLHGMHVVRDAGAVEMTVACYGASGNPAAKKLYFGVGFEFLNRDLAHVKRAG